jgi:hypothetical protein
MKKILIISSLVTVTGLCFTRCSKTNDNSPAPAPPTPAKAVYAAGYHNKNSKYYTTLWKDGVASIIDSNAAPRDIFVHAGNLYIAGQKNSKGFLWKNGTSTQLTTDAIYGYVAAHSVYVSGTDVHIAGMAENASTFSKHAIYWKNNVPVMLNAGANTENSWAEAVAVNGTDVYVCGSRTIIGGGEAVVTWKNGVATDLVSSATAGYGNISMYISGNDVYVTCYEYELPNTEQIRLWKNGAPVSLPASTLGAVPQCIFVDGADVYIGGWERGGTPSNSYLVARYWKNGVPVTLSTGTSGLNTVRSIYVDGTDVYAAGSLGASFAVSTPTVWKNATAYPLTGAGTNPYGEVLSVFVK